MPGLRGVYHACMARTYTHVVAFRTTAAEHRKLQALRSTFPDMGWGEMFRWLLEHPDVERAIEMRLTSEDTDDDRTWGLEASLPAGDR